MPLLRINSLLCQLLYLQNLCSGTQVACIAIDGRQRRTGYNANCRAF